MKNLNLLYLLIFFAIAPCRGFTQNAAEADMPAIKEIQTTILTLVTKAALNYSDMQGAEVFKDSSIIMYNATATPAMHAQQYYITYVKSNKKNYYMSYYTTSHDMAIATTAALTMNAFAGDKWVTKPVESNDKNVSITDIYCAGVKLGRLHLNKKENSLALSIGFFSDPNTATTEAKKPETTTTQGSAGNADADHFKSIAQRMADINAGKMERHGDPIKHAERIVNLVQGSYSVIIKYGMIGYYYSGFKRYFVSPTLYSKKYPLPFGARFIYQLINSKNELLSTQEKYGNDLECYFDIPEDGDYTIQVAYDFHGCAGCREVSGIRVQFGLYSQDFDRKQ